MTASRSIARIGIVGAGPGGLTAAMLLARQGFEVTVFERKPEVGGRNGSLSVDGYTFDIGPTFFMMPFLLEEIFAECGRRLSDYADVRPIDPYYRLHFADGKVYEPGSDPERVKASIRQIHAADAEGFDRYMAYHRRKMDAIMPCLSTPYDRIRHLFSRNILRAAPYLGLGRSVWQELGRFFQDDRVKMAFTFQSKYLGMSPFECPALFSILSFTEYRWGIFHPIGGCNALSKAMARAAREEGAQFRLGADVARVHTRQGRAAAVEAAGGGIESFDEIIMNADFAWGMRHLFPDAERRKYRNARLDAKRYSCSTFMLYLGIDGRYDHLAHHNIFISSDYRKNLREIEVEGTLPEDPSFYVQNASVTDPTLAPAGKSALYVLVPVPNLLKGKIDWNREGDKFRERIFSKLESRAGLRDLRGRVKTERRLTPASWESHERVGYGATFNLAHNLMQMLNFRPHNRFEEFENMWLVGGGTHPGSGLPTIYESGRISARGIMRKYAAKTERAPSR